jgi:hypothetical protein
LADADKHPQGFLEVRGREADQEVRQMVKVGLVEATFSNGQGEWVTTIHSVTNLGRECLRAIRDKETPPPDELGLLSSAAVLQKWKAIFALGLRSPEGEQIESI